MAIRRKHIRSLVDGLLTKHKIKSAPVPIERIAESLGVSIQSTLAEDNLSGFLYRNRKENNTVIGLNAGHSAVRRNFTAAHEIGHYLLHDLEDIHVDVRLRNETSSQGTDSEEVEANLFAAELLMPAHLLQRDVENVGVANLMEDETVSKLSEKYNVSSQAMTYRLVYLGYLKT